MRALISFEYKHINNFISPDYIIFLIFKEDMHYEGKL